MLDTNLVNLLEVSFSYGNKLILDKLNFQIQKGKITALMGSSGGGKTTVLKLITGQLSPDQGTILFAGQEIQSLNQRDLYAVRRKMGVLYQYGALFTDLSVFENVAFPLREHYHFPEAVIRDLVLMKLEAVGLRGAAQLYPREISGGMARRVALARAIALDAEFIIYDEPFAGLDSLAVNNSANLIRQLNQSLGLTVLLVTHDKASTKMIADRIAVLTNAHIIAEGTTAEMLHHTNELVQQYVSPMDTLQAIAHYPAVDIAVDLGIKKRS